MTIETVDLAQPQTVDEIRNVALRISFRTRVARDFDIADFTCDTCVARFRCEYAFDPYNTDGDCLAEK